ncbi:virulence-associated E family protein [Vibrio astriarenae]|uniref:Virulence-associated E family protein n=1 Tax=Vibrio astriarenae TaxID=1481923 RepID=A0A7Z2YDM9_9VIBR|nr:VapE domain-containing protein [Vibrio astriarenae]QIA63558.1 virulence-associated E family protein [Vibrio astriarenae]
MECIAEGIDQPNENTKPNYPDLDARFNPLPTSRNLQALLSSNRIDVVVNKMNMEVELFVDGRMLNKTAEQKRSLLIDVCLRGGLKKEILTDHLMSLAENNSYHPFANYLEESGWDGKDRIGILIEAMNAKDSELAYCVMRKFFIAVVASIFETPFSSKLIPVLQGGQSFRKTAFIKRFASVFEGAFLEGQEINPDSKDSVISCINSLIVELGELERTSRNSQGSLKAFITKEVDTVRPPYGAKDIKKPRQTSFIATVNVTGFLRDETGSSRYAVIELDTPIDMEVVNQTLGWRYDNGRLKHLYPDELKQFWLQVYELYKSGESWHLTEKELELAARVNNEHNAKSSYYEAIVERFLIDNPDKYIWEWVTASEVCKYINVHIDKNRVVGKELKRLAQDEGAIEFKSGRSNSSLYRLPVSVRVVS